MSTGRRGQEVKGLVFRDCPIVPPKDAGTLVGNIPVALVMHDIVTRRH